MTKQNIEVRRNGKPVERVQRKLYVDQVGNFNRVACRYYGLTYLVQSEAGDIGDPFRADASYLKTLYIEATKPCEWKI